LRFLVEKVEIEKKPDSDSFFSFFSLLLLFLFSSLDLPSMGFWGGTFLFLLFGVGAGVVVTFLSRPSHQG
jgi:hypothetical protein